MAAARAMLERVATDDYYDRIGQLNLSLRTQLEDIIKQYDLSAQVYPFPFSLFSLYLTIVQVTTIGSKGCVSFTKKTINNYRDYKIENCHDLSELLWYCIHKHTEQLNSILHGRYDK